MINIERKLTVDDLIMEYIIYKVKNGYENQFTIYEFMNFLNFFEKDIKVEDVLYDGEKLFKRFFERKNKKDWYIRDFVLKTEECRPHLEMTYDEKLDDYVITANSRLTSYDSSIITTYLMKKTEVDAIRNKIGEYLKKQSKRTIDMTVEVDEDKLLIGKYVAAEIILNIWNSYVKTKIRNKTWPKQCTDIDKHLLETDLAPTIGVKSIRNKLLEFYSVVSKRIAVLYQLDNNLEISSFKSKYLAYSNYKLLIEDYEQIFEIAFKKYRSSLDVNLNRLKFTESHEVEGIYYCGDEPDVKTTTTFIGNEKVKTMVNKMNKLHK